MFTAQLGLAFAIWVGVGLAAWLVRGRWVAIIERWPRTRKAVACMGSLLASGALMVVGLLRLQSSGALQGGRLSTSGLIIVVVLGAGFVLGEVFAVACTLSLAQDSVTKGSSTTSDREEGKKE